MMKNTAGCIAAAVLGNHPDTDKSLTGEYENPRVRLKDRSLRRLIFQITPTSFRNCRIFGTHSVSAALSADALHPAELRSPRMLHLSWLNYTIPFRFLQDCVWVKTFFPQPELFCVLNCRAVITFLQEFKQ